ncbi:hypothetical protein F5887DRAFT_1079608 [Amanita rubescens]|nr:hypothetical protein F5887DRAFT_1079608 [Amanita rubescens]
MFQLETAYFQDLYLSTRRWRSRRRKRSGGILQSVDAVCLILLYSQSTIYLIYLLRVTSEIRKSAVRGGSTEQVWLDGEEKAKRTFKELYVDPLTKAIREVPIRRISSGPRYKDKEKIGLGLVMREEERTHHPPHLSFSPNSPGIEEEDRGHMSEMDIRRKKSVDASLVSRTISEV